MIIQLFRTLHLIIGLMFLALLPSCGPRLSSEAESFLSQSLEVPACTTHFNYTSPLNVAGQAQFFKRSVEPAVVDNKIKNMILSDPVVDPLPIPYAEVAVYNSNKQLVQCGVTDFNGNLMGLTGGALTIPNTPQSYIIRVYARSNFVMPNKGFTANASVKEDPYTNQVYFLESTFSSDGTITTPFELIAYARQTEDLNIKGGAFNIYNNFIQAYTFLDENLVVADSELECLSTPFSMYWKPGFNPFQYEYPSADPATLSNSSYYKTGTNQLYISGGQLGDISLSNTDHFDDFATVHEIGHFIADNCSELDSPGGSHQVIVRIDPRLAWHEGWANYFAGIVLYDRLTFLNPELASKFQSNALGTGDLAWSFFFNSIGFSDSVQNVGNGSGFMFDLKRPGTSPGEWQIAPYFGVPFDQINPTLYPGEGHFREGAITRGLFKISVDPATLCSSCSSAVFASSPVAFDTFWQAFDRFGGLGDSVNSFSNSNQFLENVKNIVTTPTWDASIKGAINAESLHLYSDNNLTSTDLRYITTVSATAHLNWIPYGHNLIQTACTKPTIIQPRTDDPSLTGVNSDQRYSNHFYKIDPSALLGLDSISIDFTKVSGSNVDHDILILEENYRFNGDYACTVTENVDGSCPSETYVATRTTNEFVVASNRSTATTLSTAYTKSIPNLFFKLNPNKKYLLNIRSYTANKSISNVTAYKYTMTSNLGALCPE